MSKQSLICSICSEIPYSSTYLNIFKAINSAGQGESLQLTKLNIIGKEFYATKNPQHQHNRQLYASVILHFE